MPGEHGEGGYTPKFSEVRKAEESMTAEEAEMTDQREVEAGTYRMDENWITKSNEALEAAEMNGERILEIPVTISYTIKVPESAAVSSWEHGVRLENIIFEQTHNAKALIERAVRKGIEEQDPAIANARKEKSDAESEIRGMVSHNAEAQRFEKNERYDLNRARELFVRIQEIDEQYKTGDSNTAGWMKMIEGLENQPE